MLSPYKMNPHRKEPSMETNGSLPGSGCVLKNIRDTKPLLQVEVALKRLKITLQMAPAPSSIQQQLVGKE